MEGDKGLLRSLWNFQALLQILLRDRHSAERKRYCRSPYVLNVFPKFHVLENRFTDIWPWCL